MLDEKHLQRMRELIGEARSLSIGDHNDQCNGHHHQTECMAWLLSAAQITAFLVPNTENLYRKSIERLATARSNHIAHRSVAEVAGLLAHHADDINRGYLGSIANAASAATFDDLLDHAEAYLVDQRKEPAGVLAGVVFEDSVRRVYRKVKGQSDKDIKLEQLINALMSFPVGTPTVNGIEGKREKAAADVRTKATHAQWDEYSNDDVESTIKFTREFLERHLA